MFRRFQKVSISLGTAVSERETNKENDCAFAGLEFIYVFPVMLLLSGLVCKIFKHALVFYWIYAKCEHII